MRIFILLFLTAQLGLSNNSENDGIIFSKKLTWEQVKEKARKENKYIFIDCFTTWCGPCRKMDQEVFSNDTVGEFMNQRFISVRVQMDKTTKDDPSVRKWYQEIEKMQREWKVTAYPTLVFLSPMGKIVHKAEGYKQPEEFIKTAEIALQPDQIYVDPYATYDSLAWNFKRGQVDYSRLAYMINTSKTLGDTALTKQLYKEYLNFYSHADKNKLYTKENISFISDHLSSRSMFFYLFYPNGQKVDSVMNEKGFAQRVIDRVIQHEIVYPFLKIEPGLMRFDSSDFREANWDGLHRKIAAKYDFSYADRNTLGGKVNWYFYYNNYNAHAKAYLLYLDTYNVDPSLDSRTSLMINFCAWEFFKHISDAGLLNQIMKYMEKILQSEDSDYGYIDTYANLLYKVGRIEEALLYQEKALQLASKNNDKWSADEFVDRLNKMKLKKPTW
jgi:thioredoxin-related protein